MKDIHDPLSLTPSPNTHTNSACWPGFLDLIQKKNVEYRQVEGFALSLCVASLALWRAAQALSSCHRIIHQLLFPLITDCPASIWFLMMAP